MTLDTGAAAKELAGHNRNLEGGGPRLDTDAQALAYFCSHYQQKLSTKRSFERETRRFAEWLRRAIGKTLGDVEARDINAYREFLKDPKPYEEWCMNGKIVHAQNGDAPYRPFNPPARAIPQGDGTVRYIDPISGKSRDNIGLSNSSIGVAMSVVARLFGRLVEAKYLKENPALLVTRSSERRSRSLRAVTGGILGQEGRAALVRVVEAMPESAPDLHFAKARARVVSQIIVDDLGRPPIAALLKMTHFAPLNAAGASTGLDFNLVLPWRGERNYALRVTPYLRQAIAVWRDALGLPKFINPAETGPLLPRRRDRSACLSERRLREILADLYKRAHQDLVQRASPNPGAAADAVLLRRAVQRFDDLTAVGLAPQPRRAKRRPKSATTANQ